MKTIETLLTAPETEAELIEMRRWLHMHPELGGEEKETSAFVSQKLTEWGIPHESIADTGVLGIIEGAQPGKVIGIRADMDALPIHEETGLEYASPVPDRMHACGHDAHTAILLEIAHVLSQCREELRGSVKLFFQPAEESFGGAARMIEAGCLENPHVDHVLGLHVSTDIYAGQIGVKYGGMYAASDMFEIQVHGESCHGANPSGGTDAIVIAAAIINQLQTLVSRNTSPVDNAVLSVGTIQGGRVRNQIADSVKMEGIIRTIRPETRLYLRQRAQEVTEGVAAAMGGKAEFLITPSYCPAVNTDSVVDVVRNNAQSLFGAENVVVESYPSLGCEDVAYFLRERPGAFWHLGCADREAEENYDTHSCYFFIDESALINGVRLQIANVLTLMNE